MNPENAMGLRRKKKEYKRKAKNFEYENLFLFVSIFAFYLNLKSSYNGK